MAHNLGVKSFKLKRQPTTSKSKARWAPTIVINGVVARGLVNGIINGLKLHLTFIAHLVLTGLS